MRLSVLDQSPVPEGFTAGGALRNTLDLARFVDGLGYHRYWLAEHHGAPSLACASPEAMIGLVAAQTSHLRVGSGGVMLPHYSPLKVAETFGMLNGLFPGRIDLGIGRAAGTSPRIAAALQRDRRTVPPDDFFDQMRELLMYFGKLAPSGIPALKFECPEIWLLGSSLQSAIWAAELGLPYAFADFINKDGASSAAYYREHFRGELPKLAVAVWAICAETDEEARRLAVSLRMMATLLLRGRPIAVPSVERAQRFIEQEHVPEEFLPTGRRIIAGSPAVVRNAIENVAREYGAGEVLIVNIVHDHAARRRSYELIAREFGQHIPIERGDFQGL
jgi:luciferase family oxidoreductase group 1